MPASLTRTPRAITDLTDAARATRLESHAGIGEGVYDLDAMPSAYGGADTDAAKLQWIVDRLTLTDAGSATERDVVVLVGEGGADVSAASFQETSAPSPGTYVHGTLYGACAQILIPNPGALATKKLLTLTFRAKKPSPLAYSVVNGDGDNAHVLGTNAVITSSATPPAGEGGNYAMFGVSRAADAYADTRIAPVVIRFEGVAFRASGGLTAFDASHAFAIEGPHFKADTGVASQDIHNYDPRRDDSGNSYTTGETEIAFRKRSFGLKSPLLWNGSRMHLGLVEVMGFRYGVEYNENLVIDYLFANYCYAAVKLRGMSHVATLLRAQFQRCPIHYEAPEASDWNGNATEALFTVVHAAGEAYHPGQYGNPAGDRWYNHVARVWDPGDLWRGEIISLRESDSELPADGWTTLTTGHGGNLQIRRMGDSWSTATDYSPAMVELTDGATVTVTVDTAKPKQRHRVVLGGNRTITWATGIAEGTEGVLHVVQDSTGSRTVTWSAPADITAIRWKGNSAPTLTTTADAYDVIRWEVVETENGNYLFAEALLNFGTIEPPTPGAIVEDEFTGTNNTALHGRAPDTVNTPGGNWAEQGASGNAVLDGSGALKDSVGSNYNVYKEASDADVTIQADFVLNGSFSLGGIIFNFVDESHNYWRCVFRQSDGLIFVQRLVAGTPTDYYGSDYGGSNNTNGGSAQANGTYTMKVVTNGDNVKWYFGPQGGSLTLYGDATITTRTHKTATKHGLRTWANTSDRCNYFLIQSS